MINKIISCLKDNKKVSAWKIIESNIESKEFFYVLKRLELNRSTNIAEYDVTIYVDFKDYRGETKIAVLKDMSEEEINELIENAVYRATFVKNPKFKLPAKSTKSIKEIPTNFLDKDLNEWGELISDAVFKADTYKNGWINSTEIFLYKNTNRIVNSRGIDITHNAYSGKIEVIPTWKLRKKEVELYLAIDFGAVIDLNKITKDVKSILLKAKDRSKAVNLPHELDINVILQNEEIRVLCSNIASYLNYRAIYQNVSPYAVGKEIQKKGSDNDLLNLSLLPVLSASGLSRNVDLDGVVLSKIDLIKNGVCINYHGDFRFGSYLGIKKPTGIIRNIALGKGTKTYKEMKEKPYLECVSFSGIQIDLYSDYLGGEVRLGYYYDGNKKIPVTGFSISTSLSKVLNELKLSKEMIETDGYKGPKYMEISNVKAI